MNKTQIDLPVFYEAEELREILQKEILEHGKEIQSFDEFPNPYEMHDMKKAVDIFTKAVSNNEKIKFILDSDCDGLGTYTTVYRFFSKFPYTNIEFLITDRKKGYGFIPEYVDDDTKLYITADNGITSILATQAAQEKGAKVIICDHHQPDLDAGLPPADAIIDPYHPEDTFPYKDISGTFVLWFFIKALIDKYKVNMDPIKDLIDLVALTTISDVMPFNEPINRFVVKTFLELLENNELTHIEYLNTFLKKINNSPTAESFSFGLVPMINATQRMTKADHGAMFLIADTEENSNQWFDYIKGLNEARKERQQNLLSYIEKYYKEYIKQPFIVIPGKFQKEYKTTLGVISGNLAQSNNKPCIVLNYNKETKEYSGSGRSIGELNILDVLRDNPYVKQVGGHQQALGITIEEDKFEDFYKRLQEDIQKIPPEILKPKRKVMGRIPINKINWDFFEVIREFEPFGHRFKKPVFFTEGILKSASLMGKNKNHLRFVITDEKGLVKFEGVKFFETQVPEKGQKYKVYFTIDKDDYKGGENIKLMAEAFERI